jgi:hypothetical protein
VTRSGVKSVEELMDAVDESTSDPVRESAVADRGLRAVGKAHLCLVFAVFDECDRNNRELVWVQ